MELYLVCLSVIDYGEYGIDYKLIDNTVIKIYRGLESAQSEMEHLAKKLIDSDSEWHETDTNGTNFIELTYGNTYETKKYYIIQKLLED